MFEQTLEDATAHFFVDGAEARLASEYGIPLVVGSQSVTYTHAVTVIQQMEHLYLNVPKALRPRYRALMNSLRNAFGPEFWQRYPDRTALDDVAFRPRTRWA